MDFGRQGLTHSKILHPRTRLILKQFILDFVQQGWELSKKLK